MLGVKKEGLKYKKNLGKIKASIVGSRVDCPSAKNRSGKKD